MLDIGVGTGRTTPFFASEFETYTGLDYSAPMIEICKKKFNIKHITFIHADACFLEKYFNANSFDFVLFSFNGIDCLTFDERQIVLLKIKKVLKPNGYFAFSTHNMYNLPKLFSYQWPRNPFKLIQEIKRKLGVNKLNAPYIDLLKKEYISVIDGDLNFNAEYIYIKPEFQINQLTEFGFKDISLFSLKNGSEIRNLKTLNIITDPWIYYLCRIIK